MTNSTVDGTVTATAAVTVTGNTVNGSLYRTGNTPPPGDNGAADTVTGTAPASAPR